MSWACVAFARRSPRAAPSLLPRLARLFASQYSVATFGVALSCLRLVLAISRPVARCLTPLLLPHAPQARPDCGIVSFVSPCTSQPLVARLGEEWRAETPVREGFPNSQTSGQLRPIASPKLDVMPCWILLGDRLSCANLGKGAQLGRSRATRRCRWSACCEKRK